MKTVAVVPAYNEAETIATVVGLLAPEVTAVVVVDDGSQDETAALARNLGAVVIQHFLNRGQGAALKTGIDYAIKCGADAIVTFDADGQHDAGEIEKLIRPLAEQRADVVLGSRFAQPRKALPMPALKYMVLKLGVFFTRLTTGLKVTDTHNGLRAFSRQAAQKISIHQDGMAHASEILEEIAKHGLSFIEVPVSIRYTEYSKKKGQSVFNSARILWDLFLGKVTK